MTENELRSIDLEDIFSLHGYSSKQYNVKLSPTILSIQSQNNDSGYHSLSIPIDDMYGCLCMKSNNNPIQCHLTIYLYAIRRSKGISGVLSKKEGLHRSERTLTYSKFNEFETNFAEVTRWHRGITYAIYLRRNLPRKVSKSFTNK
jgi:hypothetical protein